MSVNHRHSDERTCTLSSVWLEKKSAVNEIFYTLFNIYFDMKYVKY